MNDYSLAYETLLVFKGDNITKLTNELSKSLPGLVLLDTDFPLYGSLDLYHFDNKVYAGTKYNPISLRDKLFTAVRNDWDEYLKSLHHFRYLVSNYGVNWSDEVFINYVFKDDSLEIRFHDSKVPLSSNFHRMFNYPIEFEYYEIGVTKNGVHGYVKNTWDTTNDNASVHNCYRLKGTDIYDEKEFLEVANKVYFSYTDATEILGSKKAIEYFKNTCNNFLNYIKTLSYYEQIIAQKPKLFKLRDENNQLTLSYFLLLHSRTSNDNSNGVIFTDAQLLDFSVFINNLMHYYDGAEMEDVFDDLCYLYTIFSEEF